MPRIEKTTSPTTGTRPQPSPVMTHQVLDALFPTCRYHQDLHGINVVVGDPSCITIQVPAVLAGDFVVVGSGWNLQPTFISGSTSCALVGQTALDLAGIWDQLNFGIVNQPIFAATAQQSTQQTDPVPALDEPSKLNAAFAALMNHVPEAEDTELAEERPRIRYRRRR